jgi:redox-sensitive bicupin YhaK (pirin superfamily)
VSTNANAVAAAPTTRKVVYRHKGQKHGPITRLVSPGDLGKALKPFIFLDLFETGNTPFKGFGCHPHSGIATVTYLTEGWMDYEDTNGAQGDIVETGNESWRFKNRA